MRRLLALAAVLFATLGACTVPTLAELETERVRACDGAHLCAQGYTCVADTCVVDSGGECTQGQTRPCGSNVGECQQGEQTCGSDSKFGACVGEIAATAEVCDGKDNDCNGVDDDNLTTSPLCPMQSGVCQGKRRRCLAGAVEAACVAASYGADFEAVETRCDGLDNDCDGNTDEGLVQKCALQVGVCTLSQQVCKPDGGQCGPAEYSSNSAFYEAFELSCDGRDNDCDGNTDTWPLQNLSASAGTVSRRPSAVRIQNNSVLVMWEEGQKVRAQAVGTNGQVSTAVEPSASSEAAVRSFLPAVASDGTLNWAAWAEEVTSGGALRVQTAPVAVNGRSSLSSAGAYQFPSPGTANPVDVVVAVDGTALLALVVVQDGTNLQVASYNQAGQVASSTTLLGQGRKPQAAPAGSGMFWVTFQDLTGGGNVQLCALQAGTAPTITGGCRAIRSPGDTPFVLPLSSGPQFTTSASFTAQGSDGGYNIFRRLCDGGTCDTPVAVGPFPITALAAQAREAAVARGQPPIFTTFEDNTPTAATYYWPTDAGTPQKIAPALNAARRPVPVVLGPGRAAVIFDTEGNTGGGFPANEIAIGRVCLP